MATYSKRVKILTHQTARVQVGEGDSTCLTLDIEGQELALYPEESKALRKALKRGEQAVKLNGRVA